MGILKNAADLVYTIRFLKLLTTPIEETEAFKAGIIDKDANRNKSYDKTTLAAKQAIEQHYTPFHRLVYGLKRIMAKAPGGNSVFARYGAALALIKEHGKLSDQNVEKIHAKTGIDILDVLAENTQWFILKDGTLGEGVYRMKHDTMTTLGEDVVRKDDQIRVVDGSVKHTVLGINVYEGVHIRSKQRVFISASEIK